jgi:hypothetical protein
LISISKLYDSRSCSYHSSPVVGAEPEKLIITEDIFSKGISIAIEALEGSSGAEQSSYNDMKTTAAHDCEVEETWKYKRQPEK